MALVSRRAAAALRRFNSARGTCFHREFAAISSLPSGAAPSPATAHRGFRQTRKFANVITQSINDFGGESINEGTLLEFKKKVGDTVTKGEPIASIETDKVTVDVVAEESGVIKELLVQIDDTISKGQQLFKIEVGASGSAAAPEPATAAPAASAPASSGAPGRIIEQAVKDLGGESITEGTLMEWKKNVGEAVQKGEIIAIIETDKVSVELTAEEGGVVREHLVQVDDTIEIGKVFVKIEAGASGGSSAVLAGAPSAASAKAAPAAVNLDGLVGIRAGLARAAAARALFAAGGAQPSAATPAAKKPAVPVGVNQVSVAAITVGVGRTEKRVPMSWMRKRVAQRLKEAQNTLALITTFQEADLTETIAVCEKHKDMFKKRHGVDIGVLSFIVKACAHGLVDIPGANAVIDDATNEVLFRDYVDIGVPIPSLRGPVNCTLRNVESMSMRDIERNLTELAEKARKDQLSVEDMSAATFTIADGSNSGGMLGTCFINPPASACLGTNAIKQRAAVVNGKVVARPIMYMSLTYDHRLVDGREGATFLCSVRDKLEDPSRLLLDL